jgi:AMP phosphorylase
MKLKVRCLDLDAGDKTIAILNKEDAEELGVHSLDRLVLSYKKESLTVIVNTSEKFVKRGEIAIYNEVKEELGLNECEVVRVKRREQLKSKNFIKDKINGYSLGKEEFRSIVNDVLKKNLNDLELAAFITSLHIHGLSIEEATYLSEVMAETGEQLKLNKKIILDKHSLGGVPGDKTTMLLVPLIASLGLTIPKTSSRAITSPSGTADRAEVLMPVSLSVEEIKRVVKKTNGCMVWGGALNMAPADDLFIKIEYPLDLDPLFMPSIMAKKKAAGATHLVLDLPTGRGTKVKTLGKAKKLAGNFLELGRRVGIHTECAVTFGEQPIGYAIGPALEAREALEAVQTLEPQDLVNKVCSLASLLLKMVGKGGDEGSAYKALKTGKAEKKLREIIAEQGGDPKIKAEDIKVGNKKVRVYAKNSGIIMAIKNSEIANVAKLAGAPKDKEAGIKLNVKLGSKVEKGGLLFTIFSKKNDKLKEAEIFARQNEPVVVMEKNKSKMLMKVFKEKTYKPFFTIER